MSQWKSTVLLLSNSDEYDNAKLEFEFVKRQTRDDINNEPPCACGRKIKNAFYYINRVTGKPLCAGSSCSEKFTSEVKKNTNRIYGSVLQEFIKEGIFVYITEPMYSESVKEALINHIRSEMGTNLVSLENLRTEVKELIDNYNMNYLNPILSEIIETIDRLKENKKKELRRRYEEIEKERAIRIEKENARRYEETEKERAIRIENEKMELEKLYGKVTLVKSECIGPGRYRETTYYENAEPSVTIIMG